MKVCISFVVLVLGIVANGCASPPMESIDEEMVIDDDDDGLLPPASSGLWPSGNLVVNGKFVSGTSSWNLVGATGTTSADGIPSSPAAIAYPDGRNTTLALWQDLGMQPPGSYTLSGWIKTSAPSQLGWIRADNGTPTQPGNVFCDARPVVGSPSRTSWTQYNCFFHLSAYAPVHVALMAANSSAGGWVAWDSIKLYRDRNDLKLPWPASIGPKCIYGYTYNEGDHTGTDAYAIDFGLLPNEPVVAVMAGKVVDVDPNGTGTLGKYVLLEHVYNGSTLYSLYAHLNSVSVGVNAWIVQGQTIGAAGSSHLHFRMRDAARNPIKAEPMSGLVKFNYDQLSPGGACYTSNN